MIINIEEKIKRFTDDPKKQQDGRYASFDYCFNYFQGFRDKPEDLINDKNLQISCLQLGFYLASWGMYRGSSGLLQHSCHFLEKFLKIVIKDDYKKLWEIDVNNYSDENIEIILKFYNEIKRVLKESKSYNQKDIQTLITKLMLGIFGCVPAYDGYFKRALKKYKYCQTFNETSLKQIKEFYEDKDGKDKKKNTKIIDKFHKETKTIDFLKGEKTKINYTKAKIIDMYMFMYGNELSEQDELDKKKKNEEKIKHNK